MIVKLDHVGIAVGAVDKRLPFWRDLLGMRVTGDEVVSTEGVRVVFLQAGESRLELLESVRADSAVAKFLASRGEGIHHLTLQVDAIEPILERLDAAGAPLLDRAPRRGASGTRVAFLHPRATGGVLVELVEAGPSAGARPRGIALGEPVLAYLRDPHEKMWGVLRERDAAGITLEGMDLASFDAWTSQIERREEGIAPSVLFFPMARVERLLLDRGTEALPSLSESFARRTGRSVTEILG